jgi:hypothetical protein
MISAWILTVIFNIHTSEMGTYRSDSDAVTSQQYIYKTREECLKAQGFYSKTKYAVSTSCANSYVVSK